MAAPPVTKKLTLDDLSGEWAEDQKKLVPRLNSFLKDANTIFQGGVGTVTNLGAQVISFQVTIPPAWVRPTFTNAWVDFSASLQAAYRVNPDGSVRLRGAIKTGAFGSSAFTLPTALWPAQDVNLAVDSNGAFGKLFISTAGLVTPAVGAAAYFSLDSSFEPAVPCPWTPSCWPKQVKCTLPNQQAGQLIEGQILDVTPNSTAVAFSAGRIQWHNDSGNISIDNIPGLLPNRVYQVNALALPKAS